MCTLLILKSKSKQIIAENQKMALGKMEAPAKNKYGKV